MNKIKTRNLIVAISAVVSLFWGLAEPLGPAAAAAASPAGASSSSGGVSASAGKPQTAAWSFVPLSQSADFLSRSSIHLLAGPGQTVSDTAVLTNYSNETLNFDVYGSDAYNTTPQGTFTLHPPTVKAKDVGTWFSLPVNEYTLAPRTVTEFHFEVKVPANASPGDHAGGIVALNLEPNTQPQPGTQFNVQRGEGIAVYVRVPGPLHPGVAAANIGATYSSSPLGFGSSAAKVHFQVVNTGNIVLNGKVQVTVTDIFGSVVHTFRALPIVALIPGGRMTVVEPKWSGLPFFGPVHLKVAMTTSSTKQTGQADFWIVPWLLILIVVLVLVALFIWWRRRRRRTEPDQASEISEMEDGGSVEGDPVNSEPVEVP
jgi:hypothetical protein